MKNTKELHYIFNALWIVNKLSEDNKEINNIIEYTLNNIFDSNSNLLLLSIIGRNWQDSKEEIDKFLIEITKSKYKPLPKDLPF